MPVYTTNKNLFANDVGKRLENLFWRIWGTERIRDSITGTQLARLFNSISEGDVIRTTPTQSPRQNRFLPVLGVEDGHALRISPPREAGFRGDMPPPTRRNIPSPQESLEDQGYMSSTPGASKGKGKEVARPPPILKKPRGGSSTQLPKNARIVTPTWNSSDRTQASNNVRSPTELPEQDIPEQHILRRGSGLKFQENRDDDESISPTSGAPMSRSNSAIYMATKDTASSSKAGKKKSGFQVVANTANKRRPVMVRRKSSQSSGPNSGNASGYHSANVSGNVSKAPSPRLATSSSTSKLPVNLPLALAELGSGPNPPSKSTSNLMNLPEQFVPPKFSQLPPQSPTRPSRSASPASSRPLYQPSFGGINLNQHTATETPVLNDWLVERDFRSKFLDRSRSDNRSAIAPQPSHGILKGSSGTGPGKGKGRLEASLQAAQRQNPAEPDDSAIDDEEDPPLSMLPRTKSQLTLLLDKERRLEKKKNEQRESKQRKKPSR